MWIHAPDIYGEIRRRGRDWPELTGADVADVGGCGWLTPIATSKPRSLLTPTARPQQSEFDVLEFALFAVGRSGRPPDGRN